MFRGTGDRAVGRVCRAVRYYMLSATTKPLRTCYRLLPSACRSAGAHVMLALRVAAGHPETTDAAAEKRGAAWAARLHPTALP